MPRLYQNFRVYEKARKQQICDIYFQGEIYNDVLKILNQDQRSCSDEYQEKITKKLSQKVFKMKITETTRHKLKIQSILHEQVETSLLLTSLKYVQGYLSPNLRIIPNKQAKIQNAL